MYCTNCGVKNPKDAKFCAQCGKPMANTASTAFMPKVGVDPETGGMFFEVQEATKQPEVDTPPASPQVETPAQVETPPASETGQSERQGAGVSHTQGLNSGAIRYEADEFVDTSNIRRHLKGGSAMFVGLHGPNAGATFLMDTPVVSVGRHPDSGIFLDDITVSRRHSEFRLDPNGNIVITDAGSLNGTYINGTRHDTYVLQNGDIVQIGKFRLQVLQPLDTSVAS